jgi:hypothetical protein
MGHTEVLIKTALSLSSAWNVLTQSYVRV